MRLKKLCTTSLWILAMLLSAEGALRAEDVVAKNPRVAELEDKLTQEATTYLKGRFPNRPFMVVVSIDPLRRYPAGRKRGTASSGDSLPYFDVQSGDEIQDEWDDPQVSLTELMQRVQKASVTLSLPSSLSDDDVREIKSALMAYLHLIPARDEIQIERRKWASDNTTWLAIGVGFAFAALFLIGLYFINRSSATRIGAAIAESKTASGASFQASSAQATSIDGMMEKGEGGSGDVKLSDPIRLRELATRLVDDILKDGTFPNHFDMFALDQLGCRDPHGLGGLLKLFPLSVQKTLFSYSYRHCWMEAIYRPGSIGIEVIDELQAISYHPRDPKGDQWEKLLLAVWRLDEQLAGFVKSLKQDEAFAILAELPKTLSLTAARKAFPGTWGVLLDPQYAPRRPGEKEILAITEAALRLKPLNDFNLMHKYKAEVELLEYLKLADVHEERDIFGASQADSMIHKIHKPFFKVLEQTEEVYRQLVPMVSLDQWAIALFNVSKAERRGIEDAMNEKQCYLFIEKMKQFDVNAPEKRMIGDVRARIANSLATLQAAPAQVVNLKTNTVSDGTQPKGEERGNKPDKIREAA